MTKITIDRSVVEQTLDALEGVVHAHGYKGGTPVEAITALRQALEQPQCCCGEPKAHGVVHRTDGPCYMQEPVAWLVYTLDGGSVFVTDNPSDFTDEHLALPLYTSPPASKPWVGLTLEDKKSILESDFGGSRLDCMDEAEKILKEKNT